MTAFSLAHIAELVHGKISGDPETQIHRVAEIEHASAGEITFLANPKYEKFLSSTHASCVMISTTQQSDRDDLQVIRVDDPYAAFMLVQRAFAPPPPAIPPGIHPMAVVAASATIAPSASIGALCVVGDHAIVGASSVLYPHVVLGANSIVGAETVLHSHVTVYHGCRIGNHCIVHAGTVIGADGFGFIENTEKHFDKIPQNGIVAIADDVEIGANCTIDRAAIGETRIGRGSKIDNLVMIAHNVVVGEDTLIIGQAGVSGSTRIGSHVVLAGQAGITGHVELADNVIISAQSGVSKSLLKPGLYIGSPARDHHTALRGEAAMRQLPELIKEVHTLAERIQQLEAQVAKENSSTD